MAPTPDSSWRQTRRRELKTLSVAPVALPTDDSLSKRFHSSKSECR
jgi:hypothetical protein